MSNIIPYGRQHINYNDKKLVTKTLSNQLITTGNEVNRFEKKIKNYLKCKFATVCSSGTSAIFLALASINLNENDIIIMPAINFVSSYSVSRFFKAKIYLADVDELSGQITPKSIIECCKKNKLKKVKAIIVMYHGGYPQFVDKYKMLKKKFGCTIIEDACHAFGATYKFRGKNVKVGSCKHADLSTFSLHPVKTITTGEGGIITTNNKSLDKKIKLLRSHGIIKKKDHWKYDIKHPSLNFRLNDFQCSLGISQLKRINSFLKKRQKISLTYRKQLSKIKNIKMLNFEKEKISSNHLFLIHLNSNKEKFIKYMLRNKIIVQFHYIPIYKFSFYTGKKNFPKSEKYFNSAVSLPIYFDLSSKQQRMIINKIVSFFKKK